MNKTALRLRGCFLAMAILMLLPVVASARGISGQYTLSGFALSKNGDTLRSQQIFMHLSDRVDTLLTDAHGHYSAKVRWATPCRSGTGFLLRKRATRKHNPKYIIFTWSGKQTKVRNHWKESAHAPFDDTRDRKQYANLIF